VPKRTLRFINSLILCLIVFTVQAQKKIIESADTVKVPFYNGFTVQVDVSSLVKPLINNGISNEYEAGIQVDIKHKIYPIAELGFASVNKTAISDIGFSTHAPYAKIGFDFNLLKKKKDSKPTNNMFLAGLRLGMSNFNYKITNVSISNDYWGGTENIDYSNIPACTKVWWEFVLGVRVEIIKNTYMGWTVRNKSMLTKDIEGNVAPWYIPGFGNNNSSNWGFNYTLGYHF
jgi:hypothetical protein